MQSSHLKWALEALDYGPYGQWIGDICAGDNGWWLFRTVPTLMCHSFSQFTLHPTPIHFVSPNKAGFEHLHAFY